ncbi:MAG TPA: type IX secretion system membrane protein PorP/SprF [Saprospiraceae bacterium]|nr:type IX secretion system membrane protein PorP/SprF [Saprospiraceae bacterium]
MKHFFIVLLLFLTMSLEAQQEAQFTQFMFNKQYYNPAYSGMRGVPTLQAIYRKQWLGFTGAPENQQVNFNTPVAGQKIGLGLLVLRQSVGITQNISGVFSYSYSVVQSDMISVKLGLQASLEQFSINFANKDNIIREPGDPSTRDENTQATSGNVGVGLYVGHSNVYVGISMPNILESTIGVNDVGTQTATKAQHLYIMGGAAIPIGSNVRLLPAALLKGVKNAPIGFDTNLGIEFFQSLTVGASYRASIGDNGESIDFLLHYLIKNRLGVGLAYDNPISPIKDFSKGSIELLLQYDLKSKDNQGSEDMSNPRFFF